jgi:hypothetical protein
MHRSLSMSSRRGCFRDDVRNAFLGERDVIFHDAYEREIGCVLQHLSEHLDASD